MNNYEFTGYYKIEGYRGGIKGLAFGILFRDKRGNYHVYKSNQKVDN